MNKLKYMIVAVAILAAVAFVVTPSGARQAKQPASPADKVATKIGANEVTIEYGRPYTKDPKTGEMRKIWGGLVPYGKAWRAGANKSTTLITKEPIMIGDAAVPAGTYRLYMVPNDKGATKLAINKKTGVWGIQKDGTVDEADDLTRVDMKKESLPSKVDQFTIKLDPAPGGATLKMEWENTAYTVPITSKK